MRHYLFTSLNTLDRTVLNSIEALGGVCEDFYDVTLSGKKELTILLGLLGINNYVEESLPSSEDFSSIIDLSQFKIPELSEEEFIQFYESWLSKTGRESSMDEYGQLIFIQGQASEWNKRLSKVILTEQS